MTWHHVRCNAGWEIRDGDGLVATIHDPTHAMEQRTIEIAKAHNAVDDARDAMESAQTWITDNSKNGKVSLVPAAQEIEDHRAFLKRAGAWPR